LQDCGPELLRTMKKNSRKCFYEGHRIVVGLCRVHHVFHACIDGKVLTAIGDLDRKPTAGTVGFASIDAATNVAKEAVDDGLTPTPEGNYLIEGGDLRWLEPEIEEN
jgi:hypothetical protein